MTAQINDMFRYRGREYSLVGISEGELFDPALLGLMPVMASTACWRGYQAVFGMRGSRLVVADLHARLASHADAARAERGPEINSVRPTGPSDKFDRFDNHYANVDYHLEYTGGLLLADGFIWEFYVHMGFHPAWKYRTVLELIFDAGVLKAEHDRSAPMAELRDRLSEPPAPGSPDAPPTREQITRFVERAFDRRYPM